MNTYKDRVFRLGSIINSCKKIDEPPPEAIVNHFCDDILSATAGGRYKSVWKHLLRCLTLTKIHWTVKLGLYKPNSKDE